MTLPRPSLDRELERHLHQAIAEPVSFAPAINLTTSTTRGWLDALQLVVREAAAVDLCTDQRQLTGSMQPGGGASPGRWPQMLVVCMCVTTHWFSSSTTSAPQPYSISKPLGERR